MKVYLVVFDWSTDDGADVDIEAFDSYEKAAKRFYERIEDEKTDISWVHDAFDEKGNIQHNYDFDECPPNTALETYAYWYITNRMDWNLNETIALVQLEVK